MKFIILIIFALPVNSQLFEKINGNPSMIKKIYLRAVKKNNIWQPGPAFSEFETYYDREGKPVKEIEKSSGQIVLQKNFIHKDFSESQKECEDAIKKAEKSTSFSESQETDFSKVCLKLKGKDLKIKLQYNASPQEKSPKPFKTFLYAFKGKKAEEYVFDADLFLEYAVSKKADAKNQITEEIKSDIDGKQIEKTVYKYSSQPLSVSVKYFDENDLLKKEIIKEYRTDNTLRIQTEITYDNLEQIFSKTSTECDSSGFPINEKQYDQNGNLNYEITYSYQYDSKANWTHMFKHKKRIVYGKKMEDEIPPEIVSREIKYY
ncbi:MAG: hypothetical protein GX447_04530 [Elusimicrobia bacterium]|nr:hypothetical protein [Elusimicrobiota bacterium]